MSIWLELAVTTRHPDFAEEILLAHGALSVTLEDAADAPVLEPAPGATPLWPLTRALGLLVAGAETAALVAALRATLPDGAAAPVALRQVEDQDWIRVWLRDWHPLRFGRRLWVTPREKRGEIDDAAAIVVTLDPGMAFGTGTHATTALCLEWLDGAPLAGKSVLDYGCGSGILAIAALKLGAARATAVDIDSQALQATRENATDNGVRARLTIVAAEDFTPRPHDVVLANILARPLVELAPLLTACCAPGAALVMSGLLEWQADDVRAAYTARFAIAAALRDGWVRLHASRHSSA